MKFIVYLILALSVLSLCQQKRHNKKNAGHQELRLKNHKFSKEDPAKKDDKTVVDPELMTAQKMEQMIRQKGSFIIAYVDVEQNLNDVYNNTMQALEQKQEADTAA